jgi:hypothetical protein
MKPAVFRADYLISFPKKHLENCNQVLDFLETQSSVTRVCHLFLFLITAQHLSTPTPKKKKEKKVNQIAYYECPTSRLQTMHLSIMMSSFEQVFQSYYLPTLDNSVNLISNGE